MTLDAHIVVTLGTFRLDTSLTVDDGEVVAILGPNGAGKTTLVRALAGLHPLDDGFIRLDGNVLDDATSRTWVPPQERPVGVVFQDYLLFPHLDAAANVAYGLRRGGASRADAQQQARAWLERVGLGDRIHARPHELSGGQAQRVALARALVLHPRLLLLDEPLAALDATTRSEVRRQLRRDLDEYGGTTLVVTHDPVDAQALADRIVILEAGRVVQEGSPVEVSEHPRSAYVADLFGLNLLRGEAHGDLVELSGGGSLRLAHLAAGGVRVVVRPEDVVLATDQPSPPHENMFAAKVTDIERRAGRVRVHIDPPALVAELPAVDADRLGLALDAAVFATIDPAALRVTPE